MKLVLVTGNSNKAKEIQAILSGIELTTQALALPEIQSFDLETVVRHKVEQAQKEIGCAAVVEDVSLEFSVLGGFSGPFIKFWDEEVGYELAVKIAEQMQDHGVLARCGVGYADGRRTQYTEGKIKGKLVSRRVGDGFGFDFYFIPEGYQQTFSEMGREQKNKISHRFLGWSAMRELL